MGNTKKLLALGGVLLGFSGVVNAETPSTADLGAEVQALKAKIAALEGKQQDSWLNERRAEEIKGLVREVLSDADTRASLLGEGLTAGHDGKNFFVAKEDGSFLLKIYGQLQVRYTYNNRDEGSDDGDEETAFDTIDENEAGFNIRRGKVGLKGHIGSEKFGYDVRLASSRSGGDVYLEQARIDYEFADGWTVATGRYKAPFLREELISSSKQLTVERSVVNEIFTMDYTEGVSVEYDGNDMFHAAIMLHDGAYAAGTDFHNDTSDFAVSARADVKLAGEWKQADEFAAWSSDDTGIFLGAAITWEQVESGESSIANPDFDPDDPDSGDPFLAAGSDQLFGYDSYFSWTVDALVKFGGLNLFGAVIGRHTQAVDDGDDLDQFGAVLSAGYMIIPDKLELFGRFEWFDLDGDTDEVMLLTFGTNYYINKHNTKISADFVWALDAMPFSESGLGLLQDVNDEEDQFALRLQLQLLF